MTRRALTMIEVALGTVLLAAGLVPLLSAFREVATRAVDPLMATQASFLAVERMEEIVATRYRAGAGYAAITVDEFPEEKAVMDYDAFERTVAIDEVADDLVTPQPGSGLKRVTVTVSWDGSARRVTLERIIAEF
ncbi:MAG: hypothetical protein L6Q92_13165 [Phycisphaerae bacterium]|nr:hypothetical protein [Phycisphaerae bacterium]